MGDSREALRELPDEVKSEIGYALRRVQQGKMPENATSERYCAGRAGNCFRLQRRHIQGRVYGAVPESRLCSARVSEEIQAGHRHSAT